MGQSDSTLGYEAFRWTSGGGMVGLGDLDGGIFYSVARGISADGSVIVGWGNSASGYEAFRWSAASEMVGLGDLAGGNYYSVAFSASADGAVIVGWGTTPWGSEAFIWDRANGMRSLQDFLMTDFGLDLTGWQVSYAASVSADGTSIAGYGTNPDGFTEAWVATVPIPGDADQDGQVTAGDLLIMALHWLQTDPAPTFLEGDFKDDDIVDMKDFAIFAQNY